MIIFPILKSVSLKISLRKVQYITYVDPFSISVGLFSQLLDTILQTVTTNIKIKKSQKFG